jgi:hypothetical protein
MLTYANVVSTLCLCIALSGSSYAAVKLGKNSVGSKQIVRNAVKASETARNSVGSAEASTAPCWRRTSGGGSCPLGLVARLDQPATLGHPERGGRPGQRGHPDLPEERRRQD